MFLLNSSLESVSSSLNDSGWINLNDKIKYRKKNDAVTVIGINLSVGTTFELQGTLPEGFRPSSAGYYSGRCGTYSAKSFFVHISDNGNIRTQTDVSYENGVFTAIFFV